MDIDFNIDFSNEGAVAAGRRMQQRKRKHRNTFSQLKNSVQKRQRKENEMKRQDERKKAMESVGYISPDSFKHVRGGRGRGNRGRGRGRGGRGGRGRGRGGRGRGRGGGTERDGDIESNSNSNVDGNSSGEGRGRGRGRGRGKGRSGGEGEGRGGGDANRGGGQGSGGKVNRGGRGTNPRNDPMLISKKSTVTYEDKILGKITSDKNDGKSNKPETNGGKGEDCSSLGSWSSIDSDDEVAGNNKSGTGVNKHGASVDEAEVRLSSWSSSSSSSDSDDEEVVVKNSKTGTGVNKCGTSMSKSDISSSSSSSSKSGGGGSDSDIDNENDGEVITDIKTSGSEKKARVVSSESSECDNDSNDDSDSDSDSGDDSSSSSVSDSDSDSDQNDNENEKKSDTGNETRKVIKKKKELWKDIANGFSDLGLSPRLVQSLHEVLSIDTPTSIQSKVVPALCNGGDMLVRAITGSGKTLCFLLPIVQSLLGKSFITRDDGTFAIIISPTRELCLQIFGVLSRLVQQYRWIVPGHMSGGEKRKSEKARIRKGVTVLVATPGRLLDHLNNTNSFRLLNLSWIILDEADQLLDLGFENDIRQIQRLIKEIIQEQKAAEQYRNLALTDLSKFDSNPDERNASRGNVGNNDNDSIQRVLVSATLTAAVDRLATMSLRDPQLVGLDDYHIDDAGNSDYYHDKYDVSHPLPAGLKQYSIITRPKQRLSLLTAFLRHQLRKFAEDCKIIVFFSTTHSVDFFYALFAALSIPVSGPQATKRHKTIVDTEPVIPAELFKLHGNLAQIVRTATFKKFSECSKAVLFCTDVAARGLDLPSVKWIIQYDAPGDPSSYIHRIGRTARMGEKGKACLFLLPSEAGYIKVLESMNMKFLSIDPIKLLQTFKSNLERNNKGNWDVEVSAFQHKIQATLDQKGELDLKTLGIAAFQAFVRSYATHLKHTRHIFDLKKLHLGHLAKSFGLSDIPSELSKVRIIREKSKKRAELKRKQATEKVAFLSVSEFGDGL